MTYPPQSDAIPLGPLKRYLTATGWQRRALPSGTELFTFSIGRDDLEIVLAGVPQARDLSRDRETAVSTLMALEQKTRQEVIAAVRAIDYDLVRSRLPESSIRHETIRLETASRVIRSLTRVLAASAQAELHVAPSFMRVDPVAQRFADECRFGHTFKGSFGFTVEAPVGPNTPELDGSPTPAPPLARRAVSRLARGLQIVERAIDLRRPTEIVDGYREGLNANAIEELARMVEAPHIHVVDFEFVFSPEWGAPPHVGARSYSAISGGPGLEVLWEAVKLLRIAHVETQQTIVGHVRGLHSLENPSDLFSISRTQDVFIEWETADSGRRNVRVSLAPAEYLQAVEAHKTGRQVSVSGELLRTGRQWRLEGTTNFIVL